MLQSRIQMVLLLLFVLLFYVFSDSYFALFLLVASIVIVLFLGKSILMIKNRLVISIETVGTVHKHEEGAIYLRAKNHSFLPIAKVKCTLSVRNLLTGEKRKQHVFFAINAKARERIDLEMVSAYSGCIEVRIEHVICYDFMGVFSTRSEPKAMAQLFVLPNTFLAAVDLSEANVELREGVMTSAVKKGSNSSEIFGIKEYVPGDNVKQIHWKLTSKFDEVIVKELSETVDHSFLILLETSISPGRKREAPAVYDAMMEAFVSISKSLLQYEHVISIGWFDHESNHLCIEKVYSVDHFIGLFSRLLQIQMLESEQSAMRHYLNMGEEMCSHIVYITSELAGGFAEDWPSELEITVLKCVESLPDDRERLTAEGTIFTPNNVEEELRQLSI
ncbi:hypothetical protein BLX87_23480 [Bacillus sp. VT-16-64]|nr:hypothetical protein BLX87_23480 [Bacillus sp. VT-16-64]